MRAEFFLCFHEKFAQQMATFPTYTVLPNHLFILVRQTLAEHSPTMMKSQQRLLLGFEEPSSFSEVLPTLPPLLDHHSRPRLAAREIAEILSHNNIGRAGRKILRSFRSIHIHDNSATVLNFIDGMPLSCRDARFFIFSTNNNEQLDSSFLHMDMCINMSYLKASAFIILASNCLGIEDHRLFEEIQKLLNDGGSHSKNF